MASDEGASGAAGSGEPLHLAMIAAVGENGVIGHEGGMPWRLKTDLRRFRSITTGKPVIMGRRTFASIGKALPNRVNIVVTRDPSFQVEGVVAVPSLDAAMSAAIAAAAASDVVEALVIGGGELYAAFMPRAARLYITHVEASPAGDVHFPAIDTGIWRLVSSEAFPAGPDDSAPTRFAVYERRDAEASSL